MLACVILWNSNIQTPLVQRIPLVPSCSQNYSRVYGNNKPSQAHLWYDFLLLTVSANHILGQGSVHLGPCLLCRFFHLLFTQRFGHRLNEALSHAVIRARLHVTVSMRTTVPVGWLATKLCRYVHGKQIWSDSITNVLFPELRHAGDKCRDDK
jgi:hypothetical protein